MALRPWTRSVTRPAVFNTDTEKNPHPNPPTPHAKLPTPDLLWVEEKRGVPNQLGLPRGGGHLFPRPISAATHLLQDRRSNRMFSVRPETPWCGSAQSIVSLFKNENKKLKRFLESSGKRAFVSPATASDLLISRISTIWLPKKEKGGPPRHRKNLDPPKRTSFPHSEPRRQFRLGGGPARGERLAPRLLSWGIFSGAEKKQRKARTPNRREAAARKPRLGLPAPARLPSARTCCKGRDNGESAWRRARGGETVPPWREGRAWGGGERRRREGPPRARPAQRVPLPQRLLRFQAPSRDPGVAAASVLLSPSLSDRGNANLLSEWKDLNSRY